MLPLLSPVGLQSLGALQPETTLFAFDFDGTLAPIRDRPEDVSIDTELARKLQRLASIAPVAIVTGRRIDDVRARLGFVPQAVIGSHGAECDGDAQASSRWADVLAPLRVRLVAMRAEFARVGVRVEDKGQSIALHFRGARDRNAVLAAIARTLAPPIPGLRQFEGKDVANFMAAEAPDKAVAVRRLLAELRCERLFFAGDDVNDEPVFDAALPGWVTVKVGYDRPSTARFGLGSQADMNTALGFILAALASRPGAAP